MNRAQVSRLAMVFLLVLSTSVAVMGQNQSRFLSGKVLDGNDQGVAKAIVYLKNTKTLVIKTYIAEQDGSYHFPGLSQSADYEVYAEVNGKRSDVKTVSSYDTRNRVNINLRIDSK